MIPFLFTIAIFGMAVPGHASPLLHQRSFYVKWEDQRLSVSAKNVPLPQILQEVAHQTGMRVQIIGKLHNKIPVHFSNLSLLEGLQKLMARVNYGILEEASLQGEMQPVFVLVFPREMLPPEEITAEEVVQENDESQRVKMLVMLDNFSNGDDTDSLWDAIYDPDPAIQGVAVALLAKKDQASDISLSRAISSDIPEVQQQAIDLLNNTDAVEGEASVSVLVDATTSQDITVRGYAIGVLSQQQGGSAAMKELFRVFQEADPSTQMIIIESVGQQEKGRAFLQAALRMDNEGVRLLAASFLEQATDQ